MEWSSLVNKRSQNDGRESARYVHTQSLSQTPPQHWPVSLMCCGVAARTFFNSTSLYLMGEMLTVDVCVVYQVRSRVKTRVQQIKTQITLSTPL